MSNNVEKEDLLNPVHVCSWRDHFQGKVMHSKQGKHCIINLPDRIAPTLAAESDPIKVAHITQEELKTALEELSR